jgi:hypothetical protein
MKKLKLKKPLRGQKLKKKQLRLKLQLRRTSQRSIMTKSMTERRPALRTKITNLTIQMRSTLN